MLAAGTRLGPYEIVGLLGAGGMGEVYRARDTRLDRHVAIKILPEALASDTTWRQRFEREARAISALNHPHICILHDVGHSEGFDFLVMELVDGESLASRLTKGPLPVDQAVRRGIEVADALNAAHRRGIVHRDLKPANVMLTASGAKLLDFGVAKMTPYGAATAALTNTVAQSQDGAIVGTLQYMSPEQLEGRDADMRSDIFALGLILREMITGRRTAPTDTRPVDGLSPSLSHVIERCLAHDSDDRWQNAGDVRRELEWAAAPPAADGTRVRRSPRWALWAIGAAAIVAGMVVGSNLSRGRTTATPRPIVANVNPPPGGEFRLEGGAAISPDGLQLAFIAHTGDANRVWIRALDSPAIRELPGTDGASLPFWSPDAKSIAFFALGKLKRVDLSGGAPRVLCDVTAGRGGAWGADNTIIFNAYNDGPLLRVSASGGAPVPLTTLDKTKGENSHRWPEFLPDGRRFLYLARTNELQDWSVYISSIDKPSDKKLVLRTLTSPSYARSDARTGYLLWTRADELVAQQFDADTAQLTGEPAAIAQGPFAGNIGRSFFSVSQNGMLVFERASGRTVQLVWYGRDGKVAESVGSPIASTGVLTTSISLAPDGKRVALTRGDPPTTNVWLIDLERGAAATRLTLNGTVTSVLWSRDGDRVAYGHGSPPNVYLADLAKGGNEVRLTTSANSQQVCDWSPDGRFFLYSELPNQANAQAHSQLWVLPLSGGGQPFPYLRAPFGESQGRFSPDGTLIAYTSDESGRNEIHVQRFPADAAKWQVSTKGGSLARWRSDGRELFYMSADGVLMSVPVTAVGRDVRFGPPTPLASIPRNYDVAPDGQRFLALAPVEEREASPMTVIAYWPSLLRK
jgi:eukaryotic-like serine/threonine-protein kinase